MRRQKAELAEIGVEYDRICLEHARLASREPSSINFLKIGQLDIRPWPDRPDGKD
jgi:hypothetical protein